MSVEDLRWKKFSVLDDGFVCLVDVMGSDRDVVNAARVSYLGSGAEEEDRSEEKDRALIRYMMRHHHGTPFEMAELKFLVRVPMDCWRQWIRHRTANVNEYSTRYSEAIDSQQKTPVDQWRLQATNNKQGSAGYLVPLEGGLDANSIAHQLTEREKNLHEHAREVYEHRINCGIAREQARKDLPLSTYTEAYWKIDLRNLFNFLRLRMDSHAQQEIRQYATIIGHRIVAPLFPISWEAFEDFQLNALSLSHLDQKVIVGVLSGHLVETVLDHHFTSDREKNECRSKLERLSIIPCTTILDGSKS